MEGVGIAGVTAKKCGFLLPGCSGELLAGLEGVGAGAGCAGCPRVGLLEDQMQILGVSCNRSPFYLKTTNPLIRIFFLHLALEKKLKMYKPLCTAYVYFIAV